MRIVPLDRKGPYLVLAALWMDEDDTDLIVERLKGIETPKGKSKGAVVAFRREVAESADFRRDLGRFDLEELNRRA